MPRVHQFLVCLCAALAFSCQPVQDDDPPNPADTEHTDLASFGEVVGVEVEPSGVLLTEVGESRVFRALAVDEAGNRMEVQADWSTDGDGFGLDGTEVTAKELTGSGLVTASYGDFEAFAAVVVAPVHPDVLHLSDEDIASWTTDPDVSTGLRWSVVVAPGVSAIAGDVVVSTGSSPVYGEVVEAVGDQWVVEALPLSEVFTDYLVHFEVPLQASVDPGGARRAAPLFPRTDCGLGAEFVDIDLFDVDVDLEPTLGVTLDAEFGGMTVALIEGGFEGEVRVGHTLEIGAAGEAECTYIAGEVSYSPGGPFTSFFSPTLAYGAGMKLEWEVGGSTVSVTSSTPVGMSVSVGYVCSPLLQCTWVADLDSVPSDWTNEWAYDHGEWFDRQEFNADGYVLLEQTGGAYLGENKVGDEEVPVNPLAGITLQKLKIGMRSHTTWAPMWEQITDDAFRSHAWVAPFTTHKAGFDLDVATLGVPDWFADLIDVDWELVDETLEYPA